MHPQASAAMPLTMAGEGAEIRVASIIGGQRSAHRLAELGLTPGVTLTVIRDSGGTLLIAIGDNRLALGYGMAQSVLVTPSERSAPHG